MSFEVATLENRNLRNQTNIPVLTKDLILTAAEQVILDYSRQLYGLILQQSTDWVYDATALVANGIRYVVSDFFKLGSPWKKLDFSKQKNNLESKKEKLILEAWNQYGLAMQLMLNQENLKVFTSLSKTRDMFRILLLGVGEDIVKYIDIPVNKIKKHSEKLVKALTFEEFKIMLVEKAYEHYPANSV